MISDKEIREGKLTELLTEEDLNVRAQVSVLLELPQDIVPIIFLHFFLQCHQPFICTSFPALSNGQHCHSRFSKGLMHHDLNCNTMDAPFIIP